MTAKRKQARWKQARWKRHQSSHARAACLLKMEVRSLLFETLDC
jgi:hypothetical protein